MPEVPCPPVDTDTAIDLAECHGCGSRGRYRGKRRGRLVFECSDPRCPVVLFEITAYAGARTLVQRGLPLKTQKASGGESGGLQADSNSCRPAVTPVGETILDRPLFGAGVREYFTS